jgi:hypothetical protein
MGLYGINYLGTVHIVPTGWWFCFGFTVGYFVLFVFFVLVIIWWTDINGWWSENTS